ncbi:hypothetical protein [Mycobacterium sp. NS-7484]|nr:hypothetical protein [Mycobacterium sp. NS-7484]
MTTPFLDSLERAEKAGARGRGEIGYAECGDDCDVCARRFAQIWDTEPD